MTTYKKNFKNLFIKKSRTISNLTISLIISFYLVFILNFNMLLSNPFNQYLSDSFITFIVVSSVLYLFSLNRIIFILFSLFFLTANTLALFFSYFYNVGLDLNIIMSVFRTNTNEATELFNFSLPIFLISFLVIPLILLFYFRFKKLSIKKIAKQLAILITINLILLCISHSIYNRNLVSEKDGITKFFATLFPINVKYSPIGYMYYLGKYISLQQGSYTYKDLLSNNSFTLKKSNAPLVVVLVIGESARGDHFSLNGYKRETNPLLSKEKNLVSFINTQACFNGTIFSVSCLLSDINIIDFRKNIPYYLNNEVSSFFPIFNKLGFDTSFVSNNNTRPGDPMYHRFKEAQHIYFPSGNKYSVKTTDMVLIDYLKNILNYKNNQNKLIVLHTIGSHFRYSERYETNKGKWFPACSLEKNNLEDCTNSEIINDYDNTILYTDFFLSNVINTLRKQNAIMIYTSDHGESLGENFNGSRKLTHGGSWDNIPEWEEKVPFIVWFSDSYLKNYGNQALLNSKELKLNNTKVSHDFVFHSVLDCANISTKSNIINKKLSLCSDK